MTGARPPTTTGNRASEFGEGQLGNDLAHARLLSAAGTADVEWSAAVSGVEIVEKLVAALSPAL